MSLSLEVLPELAGRMLGPHAKAIMDYLLSVEEATDEQISRALKIPVNEVRRVLNYLFENRLVKYRRTRDEKIGWYIYYWRVTDEPPLTILEDRRRKALRILEERLAREKGNSYYYCPSCGRKYTFDEAVESMFRCVSCGEVLEAYDNSIVVARLEEAIRKLKSIRFVEEPDGGGPAGI